VPLQFLPKFLQQIAPLFPTYHLAQMMYAALGAPSKGTLPLHLAGLAGFTAIMIGITWIAIRRREQNS
jgi:ABC-2 type transport system permease protein